MKLLLSFALVIIASTASVAAEKPHLNVLDTEYETLYPEDTSDSEDLTLTMTSFDVLEARQTGASCRDRRNFQWCTNGFGGVSCRWRNGQCENDRRRSDGRASCRDRTTWKWCNNDFQPRSGSCEWRRGQCREARSTRTGARCRDRGNRRWCENGRGGVSCKWRRGQCKNRRGEEEDEVSADYDFESNSADYFKEETCTRNCSQNGNTGSSLDNCTEQCNCNGVKICIMPKCTKNCNSNGGRKTEMPMCELNCNCHSKICKMAGRNDLAAIA